MNLTVIVTQVNTSVRFGSPGLVGTGNRVIVILAARTHTVNLLHVVPFAQLRIKGQRTVVFNAPFGIAGIGFLGSDEDHTVAGTRAVQSSCSRTLEDGHRLDVIRVDRRDSVTEVVTAFVTCLTETGVIHRYAVDDVERLVVSGDLGSTTEYDTGRTRGTAGGLLYHQTRYTTRHRSGGIRVAGFGQVFTFHFAYLVTQGLAVALDAHGRNNHLGEYFRVLRHRYIDRVTGHFNGL